MHFDWFRASANQNLFSQIFHDVQRELIVSISASKKGSALCLAIASAVQFIPEDVFKSTDALRKIISLAFIKGMSHII